MTTTTRRWLTGAVLGSGVLLALWLQGRGVSARRSPWPLEARVTRAAWRYLIPPRTRDAINPVPSDDATLASARAHWADHCATCHGNSGDGDTAIGRNVYPPAPDMRLDRTQRLTDGELFYAIEQGIPLTAMPAWGNERAEDERLSWELVRLIRHLPRLSADEIAEMERLNPKSPPDSAAERSIADFLGGPGRKPGAGK